MIESTYIFYNGICMYSLQPGMVLWQSCVNTIILFVILFSKLCLARIIDKTQKKSDWKKCQFTVEKKKKKKKQARSPSHKV